MSIAVLRGDARQIPLPDGCVDLVVTSPPYFGLRSYTDAGEHYDGQIGSEATPGEWLAALVECTREWVRVLKPEGSIFINLGDRYASRPGAGPNATAAMHRNRNVTPLYGEGTPKSLLGLPWRYALAATDQLGLILRRDIIWAKPNGLPESVTDRCRSAHEYVFHLVRQPRYYSAIDEIREPHVYPGDERWKRQAGSRYDPAMSAAINSPLNPLGKLPGSVWSIPSQPLTVPPHLGIDHFAAFPVELPRRIVLGWSPRAVCADCGFLLGSSYDSGMLGVRNRVHPSRQAKQGRALLRQDLQQQEHRTQPGIDQIPASDDPRLRRGLEAGSPHGAEERLPDGAPAGNGRAPWQAAGPIRSGASPQRGQDGQPHRESGAARQTRSRPAAQATAAAVPMPALRRSHPHHGDPVHACPHCGSDRLRPSLIVDPFAGTGTTLLAAAAYGRNAIGIDRSADYCRLARWRTSDPGERAKAMQVPKPPPIPDGMEALF